MNRTAVIAGLIALAPAAAAASQQGVLATKNWKLMDDCSREAHVAFPDFTAESNAKRDAKLQECLAGKNVPPRAPLSPAQ